ncbi:hypothetical protein EST38_g7068 [Candolleomyces aberdarensis]|uniref:Uncharacterized protein n=1 Tax=Candolleomyces aberdarensis TaxID=2316362 RepID=A0A4V1Q3J2_9AGAR|nr:hypothetical protein EST38_g7068 [Candolleomyces aberdarensis]
MPRILSLSPTAIIPKPYPRRLHVPGGIVPKHELYLDLSSLEDKGWSGPGAPPPGFFDRPSTRADWLPSIREAIANHKDIDAVNIYRCNSAEWPSAELWKALSGARPTHLELNAGALEECNYAGLRDVETAWPLKSVYLSCCEGDGQWEGEGGEDGPQRFKPSFPARYANIENLVLHYALSSTLYFYPEGGANNLRSLTILENDFVTTFARTVSCNPLMLQTLRSITLGGQFYISAEKEDVEQMNNFFRNAKALVDIELVLNDAESFSSSLGPDAEGDGGDQTISTSPSPYLGLSDVLPASLTSVSLRGPANKVMLKDLDNWIRNAERAAWLPNLRTVALKLDLPNRLERAELDAAAQKELDAKVRKLFAVLARRDPAVQVMEPRPLKELEYPLEF